MVAVTKTLYVLVGLPFSGKTTYAKQLAQAGECLVIERDRFLEDMKQEPTTLERLHRDAVLITRPTSRLTHDQEKNAFNDALTLEYVQRIVEVLHSTSATTVIIDGTHLQALSRSFVRQLPDWCSIGLVFKPDLDISLERLKTTELEGVRKTVTPELIGRMAEVFEMPTLAEGFAEIRTISP